MEVLALVIATIAEELQPREILPLDDRLVQDGDVASDEDGVVLEVLWPLQLFPLHRHVEAPAVVIAHEPGNFIAAVMLCFQLTVLLKEAVPQIGTNILGLLAGEHEEERDVAGGLLSMAVGVDPDTPGVACRLELGGFDVAASTAEEQLGLRVAADLEDVYSGAHSGGDC